MEIPKKTRVKIIGTTKRGMDKKYRNYKGT